MTGWEHFQHTADIGVRGYGATVAEAFEQAAVALTAVITEPERVVAQQPVELRVSAADDELLLFQWLNVLLFEMATRRMLFSRFQVSVEAGHLRGTAWGEAVDVGRHQPAVEVKGATVTALKVCQLPGGEWLAQCVVDV